MPGSRNTTWAEDDDYEELAFQLERARKLQYINHGIAMNSRHNEWIRNRQNISLGRNSHGDLSRHSDQSTPSLQQQFSSTVEEQTGYLDALNACVWQIGGRMTILSWFQLKSEILKFPMFLPDDIERLRDRIEALYCHSQSLQKHNLDIVELREMNSSRPRTENSTSIHSLDDNCEEDPCNEESFCPTLVPVSEKVHPYDISNNI